MKPRNKEDAENQSPPRRRGRPAKKSTPVLGTSIRYPHSNSPRKRSTRVNGHGRKPAAERKARRHISWEDDLIDQGGSLASTSRDLEEQGIVGVYIDGDETQRAYIDEGAWAAPNQDEFSSSGNVSRTLRTGMHHRARSAKNCSIVGDDTMFVPGSTGHDEFHRIISRSSRARYSHTTKRRMVAIPFALGLCLVGYFVELRQVMNAAYEHSYIHARGFSKEWLMTLPPSLSLSILGTEDGHSNPSSAVTRAFDKARIERELPIIPISVEEERERIQSQRRSRVAGRRMRTKPPSTYPTSPRVSAFNAVDAEENAQLNIPPSLPHLTLDLPSHRALNNAPVNHVARETPKDAYSIGSNRHNNIRRGLLQQGPLSVCGPHAEEASQLYPNEYPASATIGPSSRIVITGALSQLGMELVLQLHEQCHVQSIVGIDAAYPNTRHDRIESIETRYKYLQRRVPVFRRLIVPVFGIHPDPNLGEEVRFESMGESFDLVRRLKPTHIVHLAGIEDGRGEYTDYGDTEGTSPFEPTGKHSMMRMFDSLLSMEQVLLSLAQFNKNPTGEQPQLVYISSNEANDQSGVSMASRPDPFPASVYGTISLLKEVLASSYYRNHGVHSVGLRVPTIFGPFSRPGSFMYDLAESTIRNAAGKDVEGVPRYHLDRDRYELASMFSKREGAAMGATEQIVYVYDVASAIVAAMQFKIPYSSTSMNQSGPTLMRIGSKFTTSMKDLKERMEEYLPPADQWKPPAPIALAEEGTAINSPSLSIYDTERNRDLLGWTHKTGLVEGTKAALAWQVLKVYPYGLPSTLPAFGSFQSLLDDGRASLSYHSLPCAAGCRWGGGMCSPSPWDAVIDTTKEITGTCKYVLYTVDLRPELVRLDKQSEPSSREGWEEQFCKIAFVSTSSKLAKTIYGNKLDDETPMTEWNGRTKQGHWIIVSVPAALDSMPEYEHSMAKLSPTNLFNQGVEKAMYLHHRSIIITTDQAMDVMMHMQVEARDEEEVTTYDHRMHDEVVSYLPPRPRRRSLFFTSKYPLADGHDASSASALARIIMSNAGIAETASMRRQREFYDETTHLTRTCVQRSPNYQQVSQNNFFSYDYLRTTWIVHDLESEEGRKLRCEMYEEHSLWGNHGLEDLSISYVLAKKKVKLQLGQFADPVSDGPEEWYPLLVPKGPDDEDAITEGPAYLEHVLESAQTASTDSDGGDFYITFLPQKRKGGA